MGHGVHNYWLCHYYCGYNLLLNTGVSTYIFLIYYSDFQTEEKTTFETEETRLRLLNEGSFAGVSFVKKKKFWKLDSL